MKKIIIASGPVIVEDEKVLLNQHGDDKFWKFCGGKMKDDEYLVETAIRRAKEEMGVDLEILDEKPMFLHAKKDTAEGIYDVILVHFLSKRIGEIAPGEEILKWEWLPLSDLDDQELAPNVIPALKHFGFIEN